MVDQYSVSMHMPCISYLPLCMPSRVLERQIVLHENQAQDLRCFVQGDLKLAKYGGERGGDFHV